MDFEPQVIKFFPYSNPKEKKEQLDQMTHEVVKIYRTFLMAETHSEKSFKSLKKRGFCMAASPRVGSYPNLFEVDHFAASLKHNIKTAIRSKGWAKVATGYSPEGILKEALETAGITRSKYERYISLFPLKSVTWIRQEFDRTQKQFRYTLATHFRGPVL